LKAALRLAAALLLLLLLAVTVGIVLAPRIVESAAVHAAIERTATEALGRAFHFEALRIGLFPPSVIAVHPSVAGAREGAPAFATARDVSLRVSLLPLLVGVVAIDDVVVDGPVLNIQLTPEAGALPGAQPPSDAGPSAGDEAESSGLKLAVLEIEVRDGTIVVLDSTLSPAVEWRLQGVAGRTDLRAVDGAVEFDVGTQLESGGRIAVRGRTTAGPQIDLVVTIEDLALEPGSVYLGFADAPRGGNSDGAPRLGGFASGSVRARGAAASPDLAIELTLREGLIAFDEIEVSGPLEITAALSGPLGRNEGSFEIDATDARIRYGGAFTKPIGTEGRVSGRIVSRGGRHAVDDIRLRVANLDARASLDWGERMRVGCEISPFDLEGWGAFIPALEDLQPRGRLRIGAGELRDAPLEVHGVVGLDAISISPFDGPPALLSGELVAAGDVVRSRALRAVVAGQTLEIDLTVSDVSREPRHHVTVSADDIDTNALLSSYTRVKDALYGTLDLQADVAGTLAGAESIARSLEGSLRFEISDGRLVGVSLLESALGGIQAVLGALRVAGLVLRSDKLERFYGDAFESIGATLEISDGVVRTEDFRLVYPGYSVDLWGTLELEGLGLDMKGRLALGSEVASVLGDRSSPGQRREIPLAAVKGTLL